MSFWPLVLLSLLRYFFPSAKSLGISQESSLGCFSLLLYILWSHPSFLRTDTNTSQTSSSASSEGQPSFPLDSWFSSHLDVLLAIWTQNVSNRTHPDSHWTRPPPESHISVHDSAALLPNKAPGLSHFGVPRSTSTHHSLLSNTSFLQGTYSFLSVTSAAASSLSTSGQKWLSWLRTFSIILGLPTPDLHKTFQICFL